MVNNYKRITSHDAGRTIIIMDSIIIGLLAGGVVVLYRIVLTYAENLAFLMYAFAKQNPIAMPFILLMLLGGGYFVGYLAKRNKFMGGSGIPQIKGILMGYFKQNWLSTLLCKFVGGAISIVSGLSLGREGPSIQLGASIGEGIGNRFAKSRMERKILIASGASAGLAAAFNAPLAGVIFALEEIFKYFSPLILLSTMTAAVVADFVSKHFFGLKPVFDFQVVSLLSLEDYWLVIIIGIVVGALGAAYNFVLLKTQAKFQLFTGDKKYKGIILAFVIAGFLGITMPEVLGGGHKMLSLLDVGVGAKVLITLFVVKFGFSMISFASGAPGGIFFPLLVLGATIGAIIADVAIQFASIDPDLFFNIIILAMAGYFTAIVKAPITGIVLIMEMTGSLSHMLSLTIVSMTAYIVSDFFKSPPIYDALLDNFAKSEKVTDDEEHENKILIEYVIRHESRLDDVLVKEVAWPEKCLLVSVKRGAKEFIPKGDSRLKVGDYIFVLTDLNYEWRVRESLDQMNGI